MTPGIGALERSEDPIHRVGQYQVGQSNAALRIVEVLTWAGLPVEEVDELLCSVEAGAIAGAQCIVVERTGCADRERGERFEAGWDAGVTVVSDDLVAMADRAYERRGQAASAVRLLAHLRQRAEDRRDRG
ncbi:hypothetical protein [Streptacidiphilus anmyonensis]|uniref:hypothetical protein n=1 Tax=Streptacidiphilus anmyonensis TaxID=405782 RepID=UPI00136494ED|nr:hypothetical protein [Streptacidiphilus anmyonensis]